MAQCRLPEVHQDTKVMFGQCLSYHSAGPGLTGEGHTQIIAVITFHQTQLTACLYVLHTVGDKIKFPQQSGKVTDSRSIGISFTPTCHFSSRIFKILKYTYIKIFHHPRHCLLPPGFVALLAQQSACYSRTLLLATMLPGILW